MYISTLKKKPKTCGALEQWKDELLLPEKPELCFVEQQHIAQR